MWCAGRETRASHGTGSQKPRDHPYSVQSHTSMSSNLLSRSCEDSLKSLVCLRIALKAYACRPAKLDLQPVSKCSLAEDQQGGNWRESASPSGLSQAHGLDCMPLSCCTAQDFVLTPCQSSRRLGSAGAVIYHIYIYVRYDQLLMES